MMTRLQYLLGKLAEEANEVAKRALKAQQFGLQEIQPGQQQDNAERLIAENKDYLTIAWMLEDEFCLVLIEPTSEEDTAKRAKVNSYHALSVELGMVQP